MKQRSIFYYFAEAKADSSSNPLVLWLNGVGVGAFSENGSFRPSGKILVRNEFSWNREANMLYLETPAGVGFSYSSNDSYYAGVYDKMTGTIWSLLATGSRNSLNISIGISIFLGKAMQDNTSLSLLISWFNSTREKRSSILKELFVLECNFLNLEIPTISVVGSLVKSGIPVLVYSGDQDSVIPLTGSRTLVQRLAKELGMSTTVPYKVWFEGKQILKDRISWLEATNEDLCRELDEYRSQSTITDQCEIDVQVTF
ncbi:uncharacterized protein A4U43_C09F5370 [Asparagus officinalis]|uniref:Uncharacterized protein n=1 Tax=Asparagus officinalis TaxID=4686 RepID=A0A5P1EAB2_ASPOF|nr:uncharacterized protein A4U43_C09F5370 [Asparagus officinalis]